MRRTWSFRNLITVLILLASLHICEGRAMGSDADDSAVLAQINDQVITVGQFRRKLQSQHQFLMPTSRDRFDLEQFLNKLVDDALVEQEAVNMGYLEDPDIQEQQDEFALAFAVEKLRREEIEERVRVSEKEVQALYEKDFEIFHARQIMVSDRSIAKGALKRLEAGEEFATVVAELSVGPNASKGGDMGELPRRRLFPEIRDALENISVGTRTGIIQSRFGFHILELLDRRAAEPDGIEDKSDELESRLRSEKEKARMQEYLERLRKKYKSTENREILKTIDFDSDLEGLSDELAGSTVAEVAGRIITVGELVSAYRARKEKMKPVPPGHGQTPEDEPKRDAPDLDELLLDLVDRARVDAETISKGYLEEDDIIDAVELFSLKLIREAFFREAILPNINLSGSEAVDYYNEHLEDYRLPQRIRVRQLTVASREEAEVLAAKLADGSDFSWLASNHSIDPYREKGGARESVEEKRLSDALGFDLSQLEPGKTSPPVEIPTFGWQIVQLEHRLDPEYRPFSMVRGAVDQRLRAEKFDKMIEEYLAKLRERSDVKVYPERLDGIMGSKEGNGSTEPEHGETP